jgi:hypothetical protein
MLLGKFIAIFREFGGRKGSRWKVSRRKAWEILQGWNIRVARKMQKGCGRKWHENELSNLFHRWKHTRQFRLFACQSHTHSVLTAKNLQYYKNNVFVGNYLFSEGVLQIYEFQGIIYKFLTYDISSNSLQHEAMVFRTGTLVVTSHVTSDKVLSSRERWLTTGNC